MLTAHPDLVLHRAAASRCALGYVVLAFGTSDVQARSWAAWAAAHAFAECAEWSIWTAASRAHGVDAEVYIVLVALAAMPRGEA